MLVVLSRPLHLRELNRHHIITGRDAGKWTSDHASYTRHQYHIKVLLVSVVLILRFWAAARRNGIPAMVINTHLSALCLDVVAVENYQAKCHQTVMVMRRSRY